MHPYVHCSTIHNSQVDFSNVPALLHYPHNSNNVVNDGINDDDKKNNLLNVYSKLNTFSEWALTSKIALQGR